RAGDWWFATSAGLLRFSHVRDVDDLAARVPRVDTTRDGLPENGLGRLFEDSRGDIWAGGLNPGREVLTRWDRRSDSFRSYSDADGLRAFNAATTFSEDRDRRLWITFRDGGIARFDGERFRLLTAADGLPPGGIGAARFDSWGSFWCAGGLAGLFRIDNLHLEPLTPIVVITPARVSRSDHRSHRARRVWRRIRDQQPGRGAHRWRVDARRLCRDQRAVHHQRRSGGHGSGQGVRRPRWTPLFATTQGLSYFDPRRRRHAAAPAVRIALFRDFRPPEATASGLTPHEIRLLRLFVEGHNDKTAAAELGVTVHTVSFHLRSIYEKLQVHSKSEAVAKALRNRLV